VLAPAARIFWSRNIRSLAKRFRVLELANGMTDAPRDHKDFGIARGFPTIDPVRWSAVRIASVTVRHRQPRGVLQP
jgi:hypothetical protein